ncbi:MAG: hypothetical protein H6736_03615 [Alphaproteobacteria bacterium]|nr:hypothetical protein [Alphaproteobacteria bacterium]
MVCTGDGEIASRPDEALVDPGAAVTVAGTLLERPNVTDCPPPWVVGSPDTAGLTTVPVTVGDAELELPGVTPLVQLEAPETDGVLSFRWEAAGEPMQLHVKPAGLPALPLVLDVEDDGSLDLPWSELGLHPDVLDFAATLVRQRSGTLDGAVVPVDWTVRSTLTRYVVSGGGHTLLHLAPTCAASTRVEGGPTFAVPDGAEGWVSVPATPGVTLRVESDAGLLVSAWNACGGGPVGSTGTSDGGGFLVTPDGASILLTVDNTSGAARIRLVPIEPPDLAVDPPTCSDAPAPSPGPWLVDVASAGNDVAVSTCANDTGINDGPEVVLPVDVPPWGMVVGFADGAERLAVRTTCEDADTCVAGAQRQPVVWANRTGQTARVHVLAEWTPWSERRPSFTTVDVVDTVALDPADSCDGPVLDTTIAGVRGSLAGLVSDVQVSCGWAGPLPADGTYTLHVPAGGEVEITAAWEGGGTLQLLDRCEDPSSVLATGTARRSGASAPLVWRNREAVDRTYTLRLAGTEEPFSVAIRRR